MTRRSYRPGILDKFKESRKAYTVEKNNRSEPYKHCALVISRKGGGAILGYGANYALSGNYGSIHAEADALNNAMSFVSRHRSKNLSNYKRRQKVDVIVMRTTGGNSRPCYHCITEQLVDNPVFNVRKVIYSDNSNDIGYTTTNTNRLYENKEAHFSGFHARQNEENGTAICCGSVGGHEHDHCDDECGDEEDDEDKQLRI